MSENSSELVDVQFFGHLRKKFGKGHKFAISSPGEGVRACCATIPGFRDYVERTHGNSGFRVMVGGEAIAPDQLSEISGGQEIRIVPVVRGAKSELGQIIMGAALIAASFIPGLNVTVAAIMFNVGISSVIGGVAGLLSSPPDPLAYGADSSERPGSYLFGGSSQAMQAGGCVPVLYGMLEIPLTLISGGIVPEAVGNTHFGLLGDGTGAWSGDGITTPLAASIAEA